VAELAEEKQQPKTFTDMMRGLFKGIFDPIGAFLNNLGIMPNTITILGLIGHVIGGFFLMRGNLLTGGLIILFLAPVDALDGTMARLRGEPSDFGAFVDSVVDRYSELVIFLGLIIFYAQQAEWLNCVVVYLAAAGSVLVSYVRSRAESLGYEAKVGILTRLERYVVLVPSLVLGKPMIGMWIIAILANVTAVQRIWHVRRQAHVQMREK
jgi:CDP-diacylglycerol--glycerol-3-phosphate 3-phosphatidyltransferase